MICTDDASALVLYLCEGRAGNVSGSGRLERRAPGGQDFRIGRMNRVFGKSKEVDLCARERSSQYEGILVQRRE